MFKHFGTNKILQKRQVRLDFYGFTKIHNQMKRRILFREVFFDVEKLLLFFSQKYYLPSLKWFQKVHLALKLVFFKDNIE